MNKILFAIIGLSFAATASANSTPNAKKRLKLNDIEKETFNHKVGSLYYTPTFKAEIGYDTNSNRAYQNEEEGAFTEATLGLDLHKQVFTGLTLNTNFEIGYRETFGSNDNSGLILGTDSGQAELGFDYDLNETTTLSLVNKASVGVDKIADIRDNENSESQQLWDNDLGLQLHREITDDTGIATKVGLRTRRDLKNNADNEEYDETYFGLTLDHQVSGRIKVSPFFNYEDREWEQGNNDVETIELGINTELFVTDQINLNVTASYFEMDFDNNVDKGVGTFETPDNKEEGLNLGFTLNHFATETFSHSLTVQSGTRATTVENANVSDEIMVAYNANYQANEKLDFSAGLTWFNGEDQADIDPSSPINGEAEDYDIYQFNISSGYKISERQKVFLEYRYEEKSSNIEVSGIDADYDRHLVQLSYIYTF